MKRVSFSPRAAFLVTLAVLLAVALSGWGVWSFSAAQYRRVIDGWIEESRAAGYQISYEDRQVFGFPRRITMRLVKVRWKDANGIDFRTDDMDILATPWNWKTFDAKFKNHVSVAVPMDSDGRALMLSCDNGRAQITLDSSDKWRLAKLSLNEGRVGLAPNYLFQAEKLSVTASRPEVPPKDHTQTGLTIEGEASKIELPAAMPSPFGNKAAKVSAHMRVMGAVPDVRSRASVDAWNKDSGVVEFDDFSASWGVLDLASKGTLGFDDDLQPEGAFAGLFVAPEKTMQALIDNGFIATHDASILSSAMSLFAKPSLHSTKGQELPITIQLGGLFFGPIRIFTFPEIEWPTEPPAVN